VPVNLVREPATTEMLAHGVVFALDDGSRLRIRQVQQTDSGLLLRGFERLSPESRYRRFLAPMPELTGRMVRYLTNVDHRDHEAVVALDAETGEGIAVGRYVRSPERPHVAEVALTVTDDWQGRGVGTLLLRVLCARAREDGITSFTAVMLAQNKQMMDLLEELGPVRVLDREAGAVEVEVPVPDVGVSPQLAQLIRLAARHDTAVPLATVRALADAEA
jgi:GNAT superfamily N-acetyltransferase